MTDVELKGLLYIILFVLVFAFFMTLYIKICTDD